MTQARPGARRAALVSIVLAALALVPSAGAFTPAVFLSLFALLIAAASAGLGAVRLSSVTLLLVAVTVFLVSPLMSAAAIAGQPVLAIIVAVPFLLFLAGVYFSRRKK